MNTNNKYNKDNNIYINNNNYVGNARAQETKNELDVDAIIQRYKDLKKR